MRYPSKFVQLEHPDVLGALLSLGLGREKFGDIRLDNSTAQFAIASEVEDYVRANLTSIGKVKVYVEALNSSEMLLPNEEVWTDEMMTVSSMRLDTVIASVFNISRQKSAALINSGKVKVNFTIRENISFELHELDLLSIRGFGRFMIKAIEGRTKKIKSALILVGWKEKHNNFIKFVVFSMYLPLMTCIIVYNIYYAIRESVENAVIAC